MAAWKYLLGFVALAATAMLLLMGMMGAYGMFDDPNTKIIACVTEGIIEVGVIGFLFGMIYAHQQGDGLRAALAGIIWLLLSVATVVTATSWLKNEFFKTWLPVTTAQSIVSADQSHLADVQAKTVDPNKEIQKAAKAEAKKAKGEIVADAKNVAAPVEHPVKGHEWILAVLLWFVSQAAWYVAFGHGKREMPEIAAWARAMEIPAVMERSLPPVPPGKRQIGSRFPANRQIAEEKPNNSNVVEFTARRKRHRPTAEEISAMLASPNAATGRNYNRQDIADHYGWSVRTIGNILQEARQEREQEERVRQTA